MPYKSSNPNYLEARERMAEWHPSLKAETIYNRIKRGWDAERAITTPMQPMGGRRPGNKWNNFSLKWKPNAKRS